MAHLSLSELLASPPRLRFPTVPCEGVAFKKDHTIEDHGVDTVWLFQSDLDADDGTEASLDIALDIKKARKTRMRRVMCGSTVGGGGSRESLGLI